MKYVLLINSDKKEPIDLLKSNPDLNLSVFTKPKYSHLYEGKAEVWNVSDVSNLLEAQKNALQLLRRHPIDAIITPLERSLLTGGYLRSFLGLSGMGFDQTLRFYNKLVMKQWLRKSCVPVANFQRVDRIKDIPVIAERIGWPLVIKPIVGSGSMYTLIVESDAHYKVLLSRGKLDVYKELDLPVMVESFVEMESEYHCDGVVQNGEIIFNTVSRYIKPVLAGMGELFGSFIMDEEDHLAAQISQLNKLVVKSLEMQNGVTHLEIYKTTDGLIVGEITCRPGGGGIIKTISLKYGINIWDYFIQLALGNTTDIKCRPATGVYGWCGLPCSNGYINNITPHEVLADIPGVIDIEVIHRKGEHVQEKNSSVFYSGLIYYHLKNYSEIPGFLDQLNRRYFLEVI